MPSNTQPSGPDLVDLDEVFGDFESVPAEGMQPNAPFNVGSSAAQVTSLNSPLQKESHDIFDYFQVTANVPLGNTHGSTASADFFAHLATSNEDPSIAGAPGEVGIKMSESNSDDDWGDFVEHSASANQEVLQSFDWFQATPSTMGISLPSTGNTPSMNGSNSGWGSNTNRKAEDSHNMFDNFGGFANVTRPATSSLGSEIEKAQSIKTVEVESAGLSVDRCDRFVTSENIFAEEHKVLNPNVVGKSDSGHVNNSTDTFTRQPHESDHSRKTSLSLNTSMPIPLSLFGEEELENDLSKGELMNVNTTVFQGHCSSKALSSTTLRSGTENFSDLIASLYSQSQAESSPGTQNEGSLNTERVVCTDEDSTISDGSILLSNKSIKVFQNCNGIESSSLEEQLFDLSLNLKGPRSVNYKHLIAEGTGYKYCEATTTGNDNLLHFDVRLPRSDHEVNGEPQGKQLDVDARPSQNVDFDNLLILLIREGRECDALACRAHVSALDRLSSLQEARTIALKASGQEKVDSIEREIKEASSKLASVKEIQEWQKRSNPTIAKSLTTGSASNGVDANGTLSVNVASSETCCTIEDMLQKLGKSCSDRRAVVFEAEFQPDKMLSLAKSDVAAAVELHSQATAEFSVLACASVKDQLLFVKAWAAVLMVCASELKHALNVWKQARHADIHLALLANVEGGRYFAAIGQIYAASQVLAAASTLYRPWLSVAVNEGKNIRASLQHCKAAWVGTELKEAVRLALCGSDKSLQNNVLSWHDIEGFATIAHGAALQAMDFDITPKASPHTCGFCLLPLLSFSCLPSVEWAGCHYLLPLANIWANCISCEAPKLPLIELGNIVIP